MSVDLTKLNLAANRIGLLAEIFLALAEEQNIISERQKSTEQKKAAGNNEQSQPLPQAENRSDTLTCQDQLLVIGTWLLAISTFITAVSTTKAVKENTAVPEEEIIPFIV